MITLEEFHEAQRILSKNLTHGERPSKRVFPFTGSIKCGCCGCAIVAEYKTKKLKTRTLDYTYYHCSHRKDTRESRCTQRKSIQDIVLEKQIIDILESIELIPEFIDWAKSVLHRLHSDESKKIESTFERINREIESEKKKLASIFDYLLNDTITETQYREQKEKLESTIALLEQRRQSSNTKEKNWLEIMEETLDFVRYARTRFITGDISTKKAIFKALGSNLVLMDGKLNLELNSWFQPFEKIQKDTKSALARLEPNKKGISMLNTNTSDDYHTLWLPKLDSNQ
jgi:site-specific DNA recombinase